MTVRNARSPLRVAVAGASGTVGRGIVSAIRDCNDIRVGAVITRDPESDAIRALRPFLPADVLVSTRMDDAVASVTDALIDYTHPSSAPRNVLDAVRRRKAVVIGTSGLTDKLLGEIALEAEAFGVGVVAASNFSLTAILMRKACWTWPDIWGASRSSNTPIRKRPTRRAPPRSISPMLSAAPGATMRDRTAGLMRA
jgi:dihydrodipicolinate reductase